MQFSISSQHIIDKGNYSNMQKELLLAFERMYNVFQKIKRKLGGSLPLSLSLRLSFIHRYLLLISSDPIQTTVRGKYNRYTLVDKEKIIEKVKNMGSIRSVSQFYKVPVKNIARWISKGIEKKKGGGRKQLDKLMEDKLIEKIRNDAKEGIIYKQYEIREMAGKMCTIPDFKASKGWFDKFSRRHSLKEIYYNCMSSS